MTVSPATNLEPLPLLAELTRTGTPAMRSRGRKLLARLEQPGLSRPPVAEPAVA